MYLRQTLNSRIVTLNYNLSDSRTRLKDAEERFKHADDWIKIEVANIQRYEAEKVEIQQVLDYLEGQLND